MPPYNYRVKSGAQKGLEAKMQYWEQKDWNMEFNILTAQALNLAVESDPAHYQAYTPEDFFKLLIQLRTDTELRKQYEVYKTPKPREYPKPPQVEAKDAKFVDSSEKIEEQLEEINLDN